MYLETMPILLRIWPQRYFHRYFSTEESFSKYNTLHHLSKTHKKGFQQIAHIINWTTI